MVKGGQASDRIQFGPWLASWWGKAAVLRGHDIYHILMSDWLVLRRLIVVY